MTQQKEQSSSPHILFLLIDDAGWNDIGYNSEYSPIPTPNIDQLATEGIQLKSHYAHALCTPSRAALMTGRYHINTGLNFVIAPSNPGGLPDNVPTLPQVLRHEAGYHTSMIGKWHLGSAQKKQTPTGKGFDDFVGMYMWDLDSYTKQMFGAPWAPPMMVDWVREYPNGTFHHYAEPRHATEAIRDGAINLIDEHIKSFDTSRPLFLYVPFTAGHSPLQPLPQHEAKCSDIVNDWRREFCGMIVGADEAIGSILTHAKERLGENLIVVVTSDNGGSTWFGGNNFPLRGTKGSALEGGTRVAALVRDFTPNQRFLAYRDASYTPRPGEVRVYNGLMHISDWMPTLLTWAGVPSEHFPADMDAVDFSKVLPEVPYTTLGKPSRFLNVSEGFTKSPRNELLYDLYEDEDFLFNEHATVYRVGRYKLVNGTVRDMHYYYESADQHINSSDTLPFRHLIEWGIKLGDRLFGNSPFDHLRTYLAYVNVHDAYTARLKAANNTLFLFDLQEDPLEQNNLAFKPEAASILQTIQERLKVLEERRTVPIVKGYLQLPLDEVWSTYHLPGNCSDNPSIRPQDCRFAHPWLADDIDPWADPRLLTSTEYFNFKLSQLYERGMYFFVLPALVFIALRLLFKRARSSANFMRL